MMIFNSYVKLTEGYHDWPRKTGCSFPCDSMADQCCEPDPSEEHGLQEDVDAAGHLVACSQASATKIDASGGHHLTELSQPVG